MDKEIIGTKFYEFNQNNSGGSFVTNENLCHRIIIQADNQQEAIRKAEEFGCYWNGCDDGIDCPCCGDRWYESPDELTFPKYIGTFTKTEADKISGKNNLTVIENEKRKDRWDIVFGTPEAYAQYLADNYGWTSPDVRIFYKDGTKSEIFTNIKEKI